MKKMKNKKAIINEFGKPSVIQIVEEKMPEPKMGEARIKIEASTVSSTDIFIRKGIYPLLKQKPPLTLGYDFVGIVDKIGEGVTNVKIGDRVCSIVMVGGNAQYICTNAAELTLISKGADASSIACLALSGITAYQMFTHFANVKHGQRLLIHGGSGAVGDTLLQLGKLYNCQMVATASAHKHDLIKSYGAVAIDYNSSNYFTELAKHSADGFDAVFDFTNQKSFSNDIKLLKKGGVLVTYAVFSSALEIEKKTFFNFMAFGMDFGKMMMKLAFWNTFSGKKAVFYGSTDSKKAEPARHQQDMNDLLDLLKNNKIKPTIYKVMPLDDVEKAHQLLQTGKVQGQIIIANN
jgi:NADPH:quinone reductase-like Zn-dependent oxidoreductase